MIIVLLGIQGAGKGVFGRILAKNLKIPLISVGDLLRKEKKRYTKLGREIKKYIDKGEEVPDDVVYSIVKKKLKRNAIIDGFPRNLKQVELLGEIDKAIYIDTTAEVGIKRLSGRVICEKCGQVYNIHTLKPKKKGICDICKGKLIRRKDDTPELIKKRVMWSKRDLEPVIKAYRKKGVLYEIDHKGSVDIVYRRIRKLFK